MKGMIKTYSPCVNSGVVQGMNGHHYIFSKEQWAGQAEPAANQEVHVETDYERVVRVQPLA